MYLAKYKCFVLKAVGGMDPEVKLTGMYLQRAVEDDTLCGAISNVSFR
jgi:hypothetical protein